MKLQSIHGGDHISKKPVTLRPDTSISDAINAFLKHKISGATVLDGENNVIGVISELDCLQAILTASYHGEAAGTVEQFMTKEVVSVGPELDILEVAQLLIDGKKRRLPVIDKGKFAGQISIRSILKAVKDF